MLGGMVFFGEYKGLTESVMNSIMFPLGICFTISGVCVLSVSTPASAQAKLRG